MLEGVRTPVVYYVPFIGVIRPVMPNKRKEGKKRIAVWLTQKEREALDRLIEKMGIDMSAFVKLAISESMKEQQDGRKNKNRSGN